MVQGAPTTLRDRPYTPLWLRDVTLRGLWLALMATAFTEIFFLGFNDPIANKVYLVVLCTSIVVAGNLAYPDRLLSHLRPAIRFLSWSLALAGIAFLLLLGHTHSQHPVTDSALLAVAVFNLSFLMCCAAHLVMTTNNNTHPAQLIFTIFILLATLPIWLGPWINAATLNQNVIDLIISSSPLTHIAVMTDFDYLRTQWFYQHTPYGSIQYHYPTKLGQTLCYMGVSLLLLWITHLIHTKHSFEHNKTTNHTPGRM